VNAAAASGPDARHTGRIRLAGAAVLVALAAIIGSDAAFVSGLRTAWFDACQAFAPRIPKSAPAVVVAIDEKSLKAVGQWPWPRSVMAELVEAIHRQGPAAIALDILMSEVDASSPERLLARARKDDAALAAALAARPSNDVLLAAALAESNAVLAVAGMPKATGLPLRAVPFTVRDPGGGDAIATARSLGLARYSGALTSIDTIDRAAAGRGLISVDPEGGVIRRIPLAASIDGTLVPALAIEMVRTALGAPSVRVVVAGGRVEGIATGDFAVPTEADGAVRIYYSRHMPSRFVPAIDVLEGKVDPERLRRKLVVVGVTGLGLLEYQNTPIGERMPGSEIHAQLLENLYDDTLLRRPAFAAGIEAILFVLLGGALLYATPLWKPGNAALLLIGGIAALSAGSFAAFRAQRILLDAAVPAAGLAVVFTVLLMLTLAEATRQRQLLQRAMADERERSARIAGELAAARAIQTATLPRADFLADDSRIDIGASMVPARETGGDLYDYFLLDPQRLFFLVGDVAGKGLSASIFMAVSKALYKSATLRAQNTDIGLLMSAANAEVARDNPQMLFVTVFAGILDLETGELEYCNAGHENPFLVDPSGSGVRRVTDGDGPPLCVVSDFDYEGARCTLRPGELVCVVTDGVTEAMNREDKLYGSARVEAILPRLAHARASARDVVDGLRFDVDAFAAGADPADDLTIVALRWRGPGAAA
jgi:serine phosphatase RsbU (regulator of sigma subunit)/CHASE2 domain-containing sensor protein